MKRPKGLLLRGDTYWVSIRRNGKRIRYSLNETSEKVAIAKFKAAVAAEEAKLPERTPSDDLTLAAFVSATTASYTSGPARTLPEVERPVKVFVEIAGDPTRLPAGTRPATRLSEITRRHVDAFVNARRAEGCTAATVNKDLDMLRAAVNRLTDGDNPFSASGRGGVKRLPERDSTKVGPIPADALTRYIALATEADCRTRNVGAAVARPEAREWARDVLLFLANHGARGGGFKALRVSDVNLAEGTVAVPLPKTHTHPENRSVLHALSPAVAAMLERRIAGKGPEELVFGGGAKNRLNKALNRIHGRHPELPKLTPHMIRHTWATTALERGMNPRTVMELGGWSDLTMLKRYATPDMESKRRVAATVDFAPAAAA
jgi:integrase